MSVAFCIFALLALILVARVVWTLPKNEDKG